MQKRDSGIENVCMHIHNTICALIFVGFNVHGFHGLAAIRTSFIHKNLDIDGYTRNNGQHP